MENDGLHSDPHANDEGVNGSAGRGEGDSEGSRANGEGRPHVLYEARPPAAEPSRLRARVRRIAEVLGRATSWILTHVTSPAVTPLIIGLVTYACLNWGAVRVLPFEGNDGTALGLELSQSLDLVDAGARAGLDDEPAGVRQTTSQPPNLTIPGTNVSITALLGLLGETQVQGLLVTEDGPAVVTGKTSANGPAAAPAARTYRVRLQVHGPRVSARVETDSKATVQEAITAAAEQLYGEIEPVKAAYYYFYRDPDRSLALVQRILAARDDPRRADAHHVWGLILRNQLDADGALDELTQALAATSDPKQQAAIHLDMGYVAANAKRWDEAIDHFDQASTDRARAEDGGMWARWLAWGRQSGAWFLPAIRKADVLRESGRPGALAVYEYGRQLDGVSTEPWMGMGRVELDDGNYANATVAYGQAVRLAPSKAFRAAAVRAVGDALIAAGCRAEGVRRYADAFAIDPSYPIELTQPLSGRTCPAATTGDDADAACAQYARPIARD
jgi:tetratricopeptide (TPR) repeat protein